MEKEPLLTPLWEICTTVADRQIAKTIADSLLELHLAACIQVTGPIHSFYRWNDALHDDEEWKLTIKTNQVNLEACWNEILRLHPYDVPELLAFPVAKVSSAYAQWLHRQVAPPVSAPSPPAWHVRIAGCPPNAIGQGKSMILGHSLTTLGLPTGPIPMTVSFEEVADKLSRFPNLHFEPDGAFTWGALERRSTHERRWQLDGMIYDRENRVAYVELKGNCDRATWEAFTQVLSGVEYGPLAVQWIEQGIWISEPDFRTCIE